MAGGGYFALAQVIGTESSPFGNMSALPAPVLTPPAPAESMREVPLLPELDYRPFELKITIRPSTCGCGNRTRQANVDRKPAQ